jgi:hypothetical protein
MRRERPREMGTTHGPGCRRAAHTDRAPVVAIAINATTCSTESCCNGYAGLS